MNILVINNGSTFIRQLKKLLAKHELTVLGPVELKQFPTDQFDLIVLSGGSIKHVMRNEKLYQKELELIRKTKIPIIGICLGLELIILVLNGKLAKMKKKKVGLAEIKISKRNPIFVNLPNKKVYKHHRWNIKKLPRTLIELARSEDGVEVVRHRSKKIYGFQFHPEVFPATTCGDEIFNNLLKELKK
ncbi:gamma-glutamyl-gamma-aminobutyrate hydrolase family protein [Patescibacteria group bacterium]|nr:gamma-glutamyl-gamma-aminobutyrate hydrolase family protein [Patescibacteria group bacterium]MBU1075254.1 gamma-glutamyl-gamma-aminobutyrate hydrolase family protein [Patescibacteria group bacterium]MBU1951865.1 gamma-glutamyl-gamma-aminobutyrate hydrolase family protein [Patescibacteria group bacterium]